MKPITEGTRTNLACFTIAVLVGVGFFILLTWGLSPLELANDNYETFKSQHPDQPLKQIVPSSVASSTLSADIKRTDMVFTTDDVFSAGNPIHIDIKVILNNPQVTKIFVINSDGPIDTSLINATTMDYVFENYKQFGGGFELNRTSNDVFTGSWITKPATDGKLFLLAYMTKNVNATYALVSNLPLGNGLTAQNGDNQAIMTISPASEKILAETNRQTINSNAETAHSNAIVTSLTYVIIGLVPIGLAIELIIHKWLISSGYDVTKYEGSKNISKIPIQWNCDWFPNE